MNRIESRGLRKLWSNFEGYFQGISGFSLSVRYVCYSIWVFSGVRGRIVDFCKSIQKKYETAVSVVLGRNIDAIGYCR